MEQSLQRLPQKLRSSLYEFQKDGFYFAVKKEGRCLIADEMGLVCFREREWERVYIVLFKKSMFFLVVIASD